MTPAARAAAERPPRGEARRALILEAALRIIGEDGPAAVTHRRVAQEAGLPLAATTYWFSSKDELLAEACRLAAERDAARLRNVAEQLVADPHRDIAGRLTDLLTAELADTRSTLIAFYTLWLEAARRPALREVGQEYSDMYLGTMRDILAAAGSATPDVDARVLVAAIDGVVLEQLAAESGDPASAMRPVLERVVGALLP
ncbi:MAG TPA: TetR family transcriptional regulator [Baekduia sp.]|nr:TetR family transcriptional regulator [Baekduia sp.]